MSRRLVCESFEAVEAFVGVGESQGVVEGVCGAVAVCCEVDSAPLVVVGEGDDHHHELRAETCSAGGFSEAQLFDEEGAGDACGRPEEGEGRESEELCGRPGPWVVVPGQPRDCGGGGGAAPR